MEQYETIQKIGEGGFSTVHSAFGSDGKKLAIKKLKENVKEMWREREINANKLLKHKNIAKMERHYQQGDEFHLVFEYVEGSDLFAVMSESDFAPLPESTVGKLFVQILQGMNHAHKKGVFHRDLKLENIMVTFDGKVKIIDWGLAKIGSADQISTECVGSVDYVAPEVMHTRKYRSDSADVFSMGVILYCMLCGSLPFDTIGRMEFFRMKAAQHPTITFPSDISLNSEVVELISKMLEVKPEERITLKEVLKSKWVKSYLPRAI